MLFPFSFIQSTQIQPLLDLYPSATVAYSLRKLRTAYSGNAIRVRRTDLTEQNIGFTAAGDLDTAALLSFVGTGATDNGFIVTWYDQSGNANNATQSNAIYQPQIVSAGSILLLNSKPSIKFDGVNDYLPITAITPASQNFNTFVGKRSASGDILAGLLGAQYVLQLYSNNFYGIQMAIGASSGYNQSTATDTTTDRLLLTGLRESGVMKIYKNNNLIPSSFTTATLANSINSIGQYVAVPYYIKCSLQEIVYYNTAQETNRIGIETNINSYYGVY